MCRGTEFFPVGGPGVNTALVTGFLVKDAVIACTPTGLRKLVFEVMLQGDTDTDPTPWHCEIVSPETIKKAEPLLVAGRAVALRAQLGGRPFMKGSVQSGFIRFLSVEKIEFVRPDRAKPQTETSESS